MAHSDGLLTTKQLQDLLQVDRITVYRMLKDGRLQGFKVGGQWRFSRHAIERWLREQRGDLEAPQAAQGGNDLHPSSDALPLSCVSAIQDIFAQALELGTVTTAPDGVPITPVAHSCDFCNLILSSEAGQQACVASWRCAAETCDVAPLTATCHAGLGYLVAPIQIQGEFVGAIHAGQFLCEPPDSEAWSKRIAEISVATGVDRGALQRALAGIPAIDESRRQKVAGLLLRVATTFSEIGEERLSLLHRLQRISEISSV